MTVSKFTESLWKQVWIRGVSWWTLRIATVRRSVTEEEKPEGDKTKEHTYDVSTSDAGSCTVYFAQLKNGQFNRWNDYQYDDESKTLDDFLTDEINNDDKFRGKYFAAVPIHSYGYAECFDTNNKFNLTKEEDRNTLEEGIELKENECMNMLGDMNISSDVLFPAPKNETPDNESKSEEPTTPEEPTAPVQLNLVMDARECDKEKGLAIYE